MDETTAAETLRRAALQQLESLQRAGVKQLPKPQATPLPHAVSPSETETARRERRGELEERSAALEIIRREVAACTVCTELAQTRTQTVFGVGNVKPRLCFFGEAPGADEDRLGEPFVGRAGKLLDDIIKACTFKREDVYILNVLKCRPPNNRPPLPDEAANCRHFWERQLAILRPEYLVCLGASAAQTMFQTTESIGRLRGRFFDYKGTKVIATYHPSYVLRTPSAKRQVWDDMKMLLREMGIELPPR